MAKRKIIEKGTLNWCVRRAAEIGVSYGVYMEDYYQKDMNRSERKERKKCLNRNSNG